MVLEGLKKPNLNLLLRDTMLSPSLMAKLDETVSVSKLKDKKFRKIVENITR